jgi:hypothetical protein
VPYPPGLDGLYRELLLLREQAPDVYADLMREKQLDRRHERRIAWAGVIAQAVGHLCGLVALAVLAVVAWHAFSLHDATQGAAIICTGAVSIVAVFVTGRMASGSARSDAPAVPPGLATVPVPGPPAPDQ